FVSVVKREAHSQYGTTLKALARIGMEAARVFVPAIVENESGYEACLSAIELEWTWHLPPEDVYHAHDHRGLARPLEPLAGCVDGAAVRANRAKAGRARVALADRVRCDQAESAIVPDQGERAAEEMGDEVGVAVRFGMDYLEPVGIALRVAL